MVYMAGLFFCAMVCHGELVRLKPDPRYLTAFYLVMAAGGAAGGLFVGIVSPMIFPAYWELHLGMAGCSALTLLVFFRDRDWVLYAGRPRWAWAAILLGVVGLLAALQVQAHESVDDVVTVKRNFYGVLKVKEADASNPTMHRFELYHGRIKHGQQFTAPERRREPTTYYGHKSGVGLCLGRPNRPGHQRIGVVGLGVGTLAAYAKPGDVFRFYEINPEVTTLARKHFSFLSDCRGQIEIATGDARLLLEQEKSHNFDVLVLDAFSGDAIPAHLLTVESMQIYLRHLKSNGVLAIHVSNLHFDLEPVVAAAADSHSLHMVSVNSLAAQWMLLSREKSALDFAALKKASHTIDERRILWTDQKSNQFEILR
jgi:spermidine synthase